MHGAGRLDQPLARSGPFLLPPILSTLQRHDDRTDDRAFGADDVASGQTLRKLRFQMIDDRSLLVGTVRLPDRLA